jgi:hypothetical protein
MKRLANVPALIALLTVFIVGAAPSSKKASDAETRTPQQQTSTAATQTVESIESNTQLGLTPVEPQTPIGAPEAAASAATYEIDWYSVNGGGTVDASSTNYKMGASIGQSVAGAASSASYNMGIGFWYGAGGGGCACDCHADPAPIGSCDGVQDVLDVVQTVNVAFRGAAAILDPNVNCPYETTDVNCSASTDVIDVVRMVNVAFRGADPNTEFCDPCA